jgi:antirestriction protein
MENIRIYVASLADYNAGKLHGVWVDATDSAEEIGEQVSTMLKASTEPDAEEYAIHDHVGFMGFEMREFESLEFVSWLAGMIEEHGGAFVSFLETFEPPKLSFSRENRESATLDFEDRFRGCFDSETDFAESFIEDTGLLAGCDETIRAYFDVARYARDLFLGGDFLFVNGAVFDNH